MLAAKFTENWAKGKVNGECHMALQRYKIYLGVWKNIFMSEDSES